jgi:hypothetical protein
LCVKEKEVPYVIAPYQDASGRLKADRILPEDLERVARGVDLLKVGIEAVREMQNTTVRDRETRIWYDLPAKNNGHRNLHCTRFRSKAEMAMGRHACSISVAVVLATIVWPLLGC